MNPNLSNFKLDAFVEVKETCTRYKQRFLTTLKKIGLQIVEDSIKGLVFDHSARPEVNNILTTHFHRRDMEEIPFSEILSCLELPYEPKRPLLLRWNDFHNSIRQSAEKVEPFHISLKNNCLKM
ncbi:hypothetical protein RF11_02921 [Thelohanellus kitauei]|uniref:Uncharacterized protein n=1 Tax=Thelohanellus kitauei TaxID=669202 RepID=A0A0C2M4N1_THEKT|nr:hypothetical protein RF11_16267 [Thelohanellus kitauei]KII71396.1 hypothetical protein RF11_02921 [Thelohanellus kitauei]